MNRPLPAPEIACKGPEGRAAPDPRRIQTGRALYGLAALLCLLWPADAFAVDLCGSVSVLGRALPFGYLSMVAADAASQGPNERSLARVENGKFCLDNVAAGSYTPRVAPLGWRDPMPVRYSGLSGAAQDYHLTVSTDGAAALVGSGGSVAVGSLRLEFEPLRAAESWTTIKGAASYPAAGPSPEGPALLMVQTHNVNDIEDVATHFIWLGPRAAGGAVPFELRVRPGRIKNVLFSGGGLAISGMDPPVHSRRINHTIELRVAQVFPLRLTLERAGAVRGQFRLTDGTPLHPYLGAVLTRRRWCELRVLKLGGGQQFFATTDEDGRYELSLPPGLWQLAPWIYEKDGGYVNGLKAGPTRLIRVGAGQSATLDFIIPDTTEVRLKRDLLHLTPVPQGSSLYPQLRRTMFALPPGSLSPEDSHRLFFDDAAWLYLSQGHNGMTKRNFYDMDESGERWFKAGAGRYDIFIFDIEESAEPSLAMRAIRRGLDLPPGRQTEVDIREDEVFQAGEAEVRGTIQASVRVSSAALDQTRDLAELVLLTSPYINVYDSHGRLAGVGATQLGGAQRLESLRAIEKRDVSAVRRALEGPPRPFHIVGLAPGSYRLQAVAYGYPRKEWNLELKAGQPARVNVDMDAP